jgi:hypothetical protein
LGKPISPSVYVRVHDGVNTTVHDGVNSSRSKLAKQAYGRVPSGVVSDSRLSDRDVRVFAGLAVFERKGVATVGLRWLADSCGIPYQKIGPSIKRLVDFGHIVSIEAGKGRRQQYQLQASIFAGKKLATEERDRPSCARCGKNRKVNKACYCSTCTKIMGDVASINASIERLTKAG